MVGHSSWEILVKFLAILAQEEILSFSKHHTDFPQIFPLICLYFLMTMTTDHDNNFKPQIFYFHSMNMVGFHILHVCPNSNQIFHLNFLEGEPLVQEVSTAELNHQVRKQTCRLQPRCQILKYLNTCRLPPTCQIFRYLNICRLRCKILGQYLLTTTKMSNTLNKKLSNTW